MSFWFHNRKLHNYSQFVHVYDTIIACDLTEFIRFINLPRCPAMPKIPWFLVKYKTDIDNVNFSVHVK